MRLSQVGGKWLAWWVVVASAISQIGQFEVRNCRHEWEGKGMATDSVHRAGACRSQHHAVAAVLAAFLAAAQVAMRAVAADCGAQSRVCHMQAFFVLF